MLHIAASADRDLILRKLCGLGANPYCRTLPFISHIPETLFNKRCTPEEIAVAQSYNWRLQFLRARDKLCRDSTTITIEEIFYDAEEVVEIF